MWTIRILHLIFERVNEKKVQLFAQFLKLRLSQSGNCCSGSFLRLWNRTYCAWNYFYSVLHQVWHLDKFFLPREKQDTKKLWGSEVRQNGIFSYSYFHCKLGLQRTPNTNFSHIWYRGGFIYNFTVLPPFKEK